LPAGKRSDEGSATEEERSIAVRLQQQMQEAAAELDCRGARLAELEESFAQEVQLRKAAEDRVREVENELGFLKDELRVCNMNTRSLIVVSCLDSRCSVKCTAVLPLMDFTLSEFFALVKN
jgi:chromosome segregation ATPase